MRSETQDIQMDYESESGVFWDSGLQRWALATLNVALWDACARTLGQPDIASRLSRQEDPGVRQRRMDQPEKELIDEVKDYKKRGFQAVKIKVGHAASAGHEASDEGSRGRG